MALPPPLTTLFSPPSTCFSGIYQETPGPNYVLGDPASTAACLPSGFNFAVTSFFSPAFDCPVGWTVACRSTNAIGDATESIATCCPSGGYQCRTTGGHPWDSIYGCLTGLTSNEILVVTGSQSGTTYTTTVSLVGNFDGFNAFSVQLRWQQKDLISSSSATASSATASSEGTAVETSTPSRTSTPSTLPTGTRHGGLSTSAKIGIGVGIPFFILALLIPALIFLFCRKKPLEPAPPNPSRKEDYPNPVHPGSYGQIIPPYQYPPLDVSPARRAELEASHSPIELHNIERVTDGFEYKPAEVPGH
jgi:hypothetical protein